MSSSEEEFVTAITEQTNSEQTALNVPAFFHALLFAYQKKLVEVLGSGEAIFVHPVLDTISKIDKEKGLSTIRGESIDDVFSNFAKDLLASLLFKMRGLKRTVKTTSSTLKDAVSHRTLTTFSSLGMWFAPSP